MHDDLLRTASAISVFVAITSLLSGPAKLVAPGVEHDLECRHDLRRIAELLDQLDWWRWVAQWLFLALLFVLLVAALVVVSFFGGVSEVTRLCVRRQRLRAEEAAEVAALQQRAVGRRPLALC